MLIFINFNTEDDEDERRQVNWLRDKVFLHITKKGPKSRSELHNVQL